MTWPHDSECECSVCVRPPSDAVLALKAVETVELLDGLCHDLDLADAHTVYPEGASRRARLYGIKYKYRR